MLKTALAAAAVSALAGSAAADPVFDAFNAVCTAGHADYTYVVEAAEKNGWKPTTLAAPPTMAGVVVDEKVALTKKIGDAPVTVSAWRGSKGAVKINDCTMQVEKQDFADLLAAAQASLGFPPQDSTPTKAVFHFTETPNGVKAVAAEEYDTAAGGEGLRLLTVRSTQRGAVLDIMKIKK